MDYNNNSLGKPCNSKIFNTNEVLKYLEKYNLNKQIKKPKKRKNDSEDSSFKKKIKDH